ncbi:hypothetical protein BH09PSE1_BH09PSE1_12380 [soil metagenome]
MPLRRERRLGGLQAHRPPRTAACVVTTAICHRCRNDIPTVAERSGPASVPYVIAESRGPAIPVSLPGRHLLPPLWNRGGVPSLVSGWKLDAHTSPTSRAARFDVPQHLTGPRPSGVFSERRATKARRPISQGSAAGGPVLCAATAPGRHLVVISAVCDQSREVAGIQPQARLSRTPMRGRVRRPGNRHDVSGRHLVEISAVCELFKGPCERPDLAVTPKSCGRVGGPDDPDKSPGRPLSCCRLRNAPRPASLVTGWKQDLSRLPPERRPRSTFPNTYWVATLTPASIPEGHCFLRLTG